MSEKYNLKRNDFHTQFMDSMKTFKDQKIFTDVTLVSDDLNTFYAHKLVLSSCSSYFKRVLELNAHFQPILCMESITSLELQNILEYIYKGEVQLEEIYLERFFNIAKRFKLEGLGEDTNTAATENFEERSVNQDSSNNSIVSNKSSIPEEKMVVDSKNGSVEADMTTNKNERKKKVKKEENLYESKTNDGPPPQKDYVLDGSVLKEVWEIEQKIKEQMEKTTDGRTVKWSCKLCGRESNKNTNIMEHIELHFSGLSFLCNLCDKVCPSRSTLRMHRNKFHKS